MDSIVHSPFPTGFQRFSQKDELEKLQKKETPVTRIVLSIGGNDIRGVLNQPGRMLGVNTLAENYTQILKRLHSITPNVIITQYRPSIHQDNYYFVYFAWKLSLFCLAIVLFFYFLFFL